MPINFYFTCKLRKGSYYSDIVLTVWMHRKSYRIIRQFLIPISGIQGDIRELNQEADNPKTENDTFRKTTKCNA
jgi:hypothetical protein